MTGYLLRETGVVEKVGEECEKGVGGFETENDEVLEVRTKRDGSSEKGSTNARVEGEEEDQCGSSKIQWRRL